MVPKAIYLATTFIADKHDFETINVLQDIC